MAKFYVSAAMLEKRGACEYGIEKFRRTFGARAEVNLANVKKAIAADLDIRWVAYLHAIRDEPGASSIYEELSDIEWRSSKAERVLALLNEAGCLWAKVKAREAR